MNEIKRLVTYYPTCINDNGYLIPSVTTQAYALNPENNKWYLTMYKMPYGNWKAVLDEWGNSKNNTEQIQYFKNWRDFFNKSKPTMPITHSSTYLTLQGAASHKIFWQWKRDKLWTSPCKTIAPSKIELYLSSGLPSNMSNKSNFAMPFTPDSKSSLGIIELDEAKLKPHYTCFFDGDEHAEENTRRAIEALKSPHPDTAVELLGLMDLVSKVYFNKLITSDNYTVYDIIRTIITVEGTEYSHDIMPEYFILLIRYLYQQCLGWWYECEFGAVFKLS